MFCTQVDKNRSKYYIKSTNDQNEHIYIYVKFLNPIGYLNIFMAVKTEYFRIILNTIILINNQQS